MWSFRPGLGGEQGEPEATGTNAPEARPGTLRAPACHASGTINTQRGTGGGPTSQKELAHPRVTP